MPVASTQGGIGLPIPDASTTTPGHVDLRACLAAYLDTAVPSLRAFGSGWETTIFEFVIESRSSRVPGLPIASPLVLRVYQGASADHKAAREGRTMFRMAAAGYPVPRPYHLERNTTAIGSPFLIMDRVAGGPLFVTKSFPQAFTTFSLGFIAFVRAQVRLHRLTIAGDDAADRSDANTGPDAASEDAGNGQPPHARNTSSAPGPPTLLDRMLNVVADRIACGPLPGLGDALVSLRARADRYRIAPLANVHMDYHPQNVIVRGIRVTGIVDWVSADRGDRHLDAATTSAILATSAMDHPRWMRDNPAGNSLRMLFAALYFPAYHALAPMELDRFRYCQAVAALYRLSTLGMMRTRGPESVGYRPAAIANVTPDVLRLLSRYATRKSGTPVTI
jgi:aminoglycoside phosphotransferase (APT) family kinase protein